MAEEATESRVALGGWKAQGLRVTLFPGSWEAPKDLNWWAQVAGSEPESRTTKAHQGLTEESGPLADCQLQLAIHPTRVEWVLTPQSQPEDQQVTLATLGPLEHALRVFCPAMERWLGLATCPPSNRLAFGAMLLLPVEDRIRGYRQLAEFLGHVQLDPQASSDFLYQINRRRPSFTAVTGLVINRLSTWSVMTWQTGQALLQGVEIAKPVKIDQGFACRLALDINTAPEFQGQLPAEQLQHVFRELVDLGVEIAHKGDIP